MQKRQFDENGQAMASSGAKEQPTTNPGEALISAGKLYELQVSRLSEEHFLALYWATVSEYKSTAYNITNYFDDLKHLGLTRTKQTAMAAIEALRLLGLIDLKDAKNRKNIYITHFGANALQRLVRAGGFKSKPSEYLESKAK